MRSPHLFKEINIDEVSNGFMAIKVNKGVSEVEFIYETKGQRIGIVMSVLGITLYLCYLLFTKNVKYLINIYWFLILIWYNYYVIM